MQDQAEVSLSLPSAPVWWEIRCLLIAKHLSWLCFSLQPSTSAALLLLLERRKERGTRHQTTRTGRSALLHLLRWRTT